MKRNHYLFLSVVVCMITLWSCNNPRYFYQAQAVDLTVMPKGKTFSVKGASTLQLPDTFVWGASPIKIEDRYYLFFSAWESGPQIPKFSDSWVLYSKIGLAVSDEPDRNFKKLDIFLKGRNHEGDSTAWDAQSAHNPLIKKFNNKYYLYYVSSVDPGEQPPESPGASLTKRNRVQQNQKIGVVVFDSVEELLTGDYERSEQPLLSPRTRVKKDNVVNPSPAGTKAMPDNLIVVNPAIVYRPADSKYLLYFKGNIYDPHWRGVHGVAIGDSPAGPFTATDHFVFDFDDGSGKKVSAEDPYVWYHKKDKCFYAVVKDFTGKLTKSEPGLAMLSSENGIDWKPANQPLFMKKELILKDGTQLKVNRLERPQLLLNDDGDPIVLYAACSVDPCDQKQDGGTFNIHIPIKKVLSGE
jgi:hypothetical protein